MEIRDLRADEVEVRVAMVNEKGCTLLLYKDARCDMNILDETFGMENWQRKHELINGNLFCSVGIRFSGEWVWKQDVGVESYTEKEKGQASDAFKRSCTNVGIGRELYTAPFIWVIADKIDIVKRNDGKYQVNSKFKVTEMTVENKRITSLTIAAKSRNSEWSTVYSFKQENPAQERTELLNALQNMDKKIAKLKDTGDGKMIEFCLKTKKINKAVDECTVAELKSIVPVMMQLLDKAEEKKGE